MLEVCVDTVSAALAAVAAGADRIELCAALDVGGVTPCEALIKAVRQRVACPVVVLIRPRAGDFIYDASERAQSLDSIQSALALGADGVVVGALDAQGDLDMPLIADMRRAAGTSQFVMHRAFDFVRDPLRAIDQLVSIGCHRILTSGGSTGLVMNHLHELKQLIDCAANRLVVMPGGGVNEHNAAEIIRACRCSELHGSFRLKQADSADGLGWCQPIDTCAVRSVSSILRRAIEQED